MAIANKPTELTEQVLESVKAGEQAALDAVRKFIDTVDQALPRLGAAPFLAAAGDRFRSGDGRRSRPGAIRLPPQRRAIGWPVAGGVATRGEVERPNEQVAGIPIRPLRDGNPVNVNRVHHGCGERQQPQRPTGLRLLSVSCVACCQHAQHIPVAREVGDTAGPRERADLPPRRRRRRRGGRPQPLSVGRTGQCWDNAHRIDLAQQVPVAPASGCPQAAGHGGDNHWWLRSSGDLRPYPVRPGREG